MAANGTYATNLKPLIDADLPTGYRCLGVVGFSTNDQHAFVVALRYVNYAYSCQIGPSVALTNKSLIVMYLAVAI